MSDFAIFNPQEVEWTDFGPGAPKTAIFQGSDSLTIQYFELPAKSKGEAHAHVEEQIVYVLHGHLGINFGGKDFFAHQGSLVIIPPNIPHYGFNPCNETAMTMEIFSPKRDKPQSAKLDDFSLNS